MNKSEYLAEAKKVRKLLEKKINSIAMAENTLRETAGRDTSGFHNDPTVLSKAVEIAGSNPISALDLAKAVLEKSELPWKSKPSFPAAGAAGAAAESFWPKSKLVANALVLKRPKHITTTRNIDKTLEIVFMLSSPYMFVCLKLQYHTAQRKSLQFTSSAVQL
jgi:hypothetical protein